MKQSILLTFVLMWVFLGQIAFADPSKQCPSFLDNEFKRLHSSEKINLCSLYNGKPMLLVNTASHCGFTKQFKPLEALYQKYKEQGFQIVGFSSNDFNQEDSSEEKAATICYKNYGVTFTMLAPTKVRGDNANAVFKYLYTSTGKKPKWNFNKYLIATTENGLDIQHFGSTTAPLNSKLEKQVSNQLKF